MVGPLLLDGPQVPQNGSTYCDTGVQTQEPVEDIPYLNHNRHTSRKLVFIQAVNKTDVSSKELNLKLHSCFGGPSGHEDPEKARKTRFSKLSIFWPILGQSIGKHSSGKDQLFFFLL